MYSQNINNIGENFENMKLTPNEQKLFDLFFEDYEYQFENILKISEKNLFNIIYNHISSLLGKKKFIKYSKLSLSKIQSLLQTKYYLEDLKASKKFMNYLNSHEDKTKILIELNIKNIIPHCKNCKTIYHSCGEIINYSEEYDYVICLKCNEIYYPSLLHLYCDKCQEEYYSNIIEKENKNGDFELATWEKYHCKPQLENNMKCPRCNEDLYFSQKIKILKCFNCNWKNKIIDTFWICCNCNEKFNSNCKIYNRIENINEKICIRNALVNKNYAKPENISCCKFDMKNIMFQHNIDCDGNLIYGILNKKKVLVCDKCYDINKIENYSWLCPKCNQNFVCSIIKKINHQKGKSDNDLDKYVNKRQTVSNLLRKIKKDLKINNNHILIDSTDRIYKINISPNHYAQRQKIRNAFRESIPISPVLSKRNNGVIKKSIDYQKLSRNANLKESHTNSNNNLIFKTQDSILFNPMNSRVNSSDRRSICPIESYGNFRKNNSGVINLSSFNKTDNSIHNNNNNIFQYNDINNNIENPLSRRQKTKSINGIRMNMNMNNVKLNLNLNININNILNTVLPFNIEPNENIKPEEYIIDKLIGEGSIGKIFSTTWIKNNKKYALKKMSLTKKTQIEHLKEEYNLIMRFINKTRCDGIIKIYGDKIEQINENQFLYYLLMELALIDWEKDLNERNKINKYYNEEELIEIIKNLVKTFSELQKNNICHRDIKPQNILIFENNKYKIGDFSEAKTIKYGEQIHTLRGTELYMSPILFKAFKFKRNQVLHNPYKSDVFSLGMCMFQCCTLTYKSLFSIRELKNMNNLKDILVKYLISRYSYDFIDILLKMLEIDEKKRFDFIQLESFLFQN